MPHNPFTTPRILNACTVGSQFWTAGLGLYFVRTEIGTLLCALGILITLFIWWPSLKCIPNISIREWPWPMLILLLIYVCVAGSLTYSSIDKSRVELADQPHSKSRSIDPKAEFDVSGGDVSVGDMTTRGDPIPVAKVSGGKLAIGHLAVTGPNAPPIDLPEPSAEIKGWSKTQLKSNLLILADEIHKVGITFDEWDKNDDNHRKSLPTKNWAQESEKLMTSTANRKQKLFIENYFLICGQYLSASLKFIGEKLTIADPMITGNFETYERDRRAQAGLIEIRDRMGFQPNDIEYLLIYVQSKL